MPAKLWQTLTHKKQAKNCKYVHLFSKNQFILKKSTKQKTSTLKLQNLKNSQLNKNFKLNWTNFEKICSYKNQNFFKKLTFMENFVKFLP